MRIKPLFLDYFEQTWVRGSFPPQLWNMNNKVRGLTNNPQEGFNSKMNKLIQTKQPNPNVLVTHLAGCLNDSEMRFWKIKVSTHLSFYFNLKIDFILRLAVQRLVGLPN